MARTGTKIPLTMTIFILMTSLVTSMVVKNTITCIYSNQKQGFGCSIENENFKSGTDDYIFTGSAKQKNSTKLISIRRSMMEELPNFFEDFPKLTCLVIRETKLNILMNNNFTPLKTLFLDYNDIKSMGKEAFGDLTNLENLFIHGNLIEKFPSGFFEKNVKLKVIHLGNNMVRELQGNLLEKQYSLEEFYVSNNQLKILPKTLFRHNKHLKIAFFGDNQIASVDVALLSGLYKLESISFYNNRLEFIPEKFFKDNLSLKLIDLERNRIKMLSPLMFENQKKMTLVGFAGNICANVTFESTTNVTVGIVIPPKECVDNFLSSDKCDDIVISPNVQIDFLHKLQESSENDTFLQKVKNAIYENQIRNLQDAITKLQQLLLGNL